MKRFIFLFLGLITLIGCERYNITGTWIQPIPGIESESQGITINPDGTATSVNMHTLQYKTWVLDGNILTLCGVSIGNHTTMDFCSDFAVKMPDNDTLILQSKYYDDTYTRKK